MKKRKTPARVPEYSSPAPEITTSGSPKWLIALVLISIIVQAILLFIAPKPKANIYDAKVIWKNAWVESDDYGHVVVNVTGQTENQSATLVNGTNVSTNASSAIGTDIDVVSTGYKEVQINLIADIWNRTKVGNVYSFECRSSLDGHIFCDKLLAGELENTAIVPPGSTTESQNTTKKNGIGNCIKIGNISIINCN